MSTVLVVDDAALDREGGRGLVLIMTFMEDVVFNAVGNQVTMKKRAGQTPAPQNEVV